MNSGPSAIPRRPGSHITRTMGAETIPSRIFIPSRVQIRQDNNVVFPRIPARFESLATRPRKVVRPANAVNIKVNRHPRAQYQCRAS